MRPEEASRAQFGAAARHFDTPLTRLFLGPGWTLVLEAVEALARGRRFARALDLGCGSGALLAMLAPRCGQVLGVDVAGPMLGVARGRGVRGIQALAQRLPLRDGSVDLVASTHSAHHFGDPEAALDEAMRVLRHGGLLAWADLERRGLRGTLVDVLARRFEPSHVGLLDPEELRGALEARGLQELRVVRARAALLPVFVVAGKKP